MTTPTPEGISRLAAIMRTLAHPHPLTDTEADEVARALEMHAIHLQREARDDEQRASLQAVGASQYRSLVEMVAALQCDYDRLAELREARDTCVLGAPDGTETPDPEGWAMAFPDDAAELAALEVAAGDCDGEEAARTRIEEDALSVHVRSDWYSPGNAHDAEPAEFTILLATGGPAARIIGELDEHMQPSRARLQVQDWFTPWTDHHDADEAVLLAYASVFYYGEG